MGHLSARDRRARIRCASRQLRFRGGLVRRGEGARHAGGAEGLARQAAIQGRRERPRASGDPLRRHRAGDGRRRPAGDDEIRRGDRQRGRHRPRSDARLGARRLCDGVPLPPDGPRGEAHARPRRRPDLGRRRPGRARPEHRARRARRDPPAAGHGGRAHARQPAGRHGGLRHAGRRRCRHPQPHPLRDARPGGLLFRPAAARHGDPRRLQPADRPHAGRARHRALRRRWAGRPHGRPDAHRRAARLPFRRGAGRRGRHGARHRAAARLQRHGTADGDGLVGRRRRPCGEGRARPRSGRGDREPAEIPGARRPLAARARPCLGLRGCGHDRRCGHHHRRGRIGRSGLRQPLRRARRGRAQADPRSGLGREGRRRRGHRVDDAARRRGAGRRT